MRKIPGLLLVGLFALGCSKTPLKQPPANVLDQEFGGITTADEAPAFGDETLLRAGAGELDAGDPVTAAIEADAASGRLALFALRILWGQLRYDSASTVPTTWDGALIVDSGRVGVVRTIRFEPGQDYLVRPRTAPNRVEWVSRTTVHNDGLLLLIAVNTAVLSDSSANRVHFRTAPLAVTFTLRQLVALDTVITVDDAGNAVMFHGVRVEPHACPRGFLAGRWIFAEGDRGGEFRGRWMSRDGRLMGFLMGRFGINGDGRRVFFGKYVNADGTFEGRLRGVWGPAPFTNRGGFFKGVFYDPLDRPAGRLHGHWRADAPGEGLFQGVWMVRCAHWDECDDHWDDWDDPEFDPAGLDAGERGDGA